MTNPIQTCEYCTAPLSAGANFCEACGRPVRKSGATLPEPPPIPPQAPPVTSTAPHYPQSGPPYRSLSAEEVEQATTPPPAAQGAARMPPVPPQMPPAPPRRGSKLPYILAGAGCLVLLCIAVVVAAVIAFRNFDAVSESVVPPAITQIVIAPTTQPEATQPPAPTRSLQPTDAPGQPTTALPAGDDNWPAGIGQQLIGNYFSDDFTTNKFEWADVEDEIRTWGVQDGHYTLHLKEPDYSIWAYLPVEFTPTTITFDAAVQPGFDEGGYGVLCHYQDEDNYHVVSIDPLNKEYSIGYFVNGDYQSLIREDWVDALHLKESPHAINNVIIVCEPESMTLMINNELEAQVELESATPGRTALLGETWEDTAAPGFKALFDNFFAYIPAQ